MLERAPVSVCEVIVGGLDHPECVSVGEAGELYAGGEAGQIYRVDPAQGRSEVIADTGAESGGHALDAGGNLHECSMAGVVNWISPGGEIVERSTGTGDLPMSVPNYPVFAEDGTLFVSDSGDWDACNGRIYAIRPSGETELAFPDYLAFPNGMALDEQAGWLYIVQSNVRNIIRIRHSSGELVGRPQIYAVMPSIGLADGLARAESGNLYVACFEPSALLRVRPDGRIDVVLQELLLGVFNRPTNVAFARGGSDRLFYANYGGGELGALNVGEAGAPLVYPDLQVPKRS